MTRLIKILGVIGTLISIYYAVYLHADREYDKEVTELEKEISIAKTQIYNSSTDFAFRKLPHIQNTKIRLKPSLFSPYSVLVSLFGEKSYSVDHAYQVVEIFQGKKGKLNNLRFENLVFGKKLKEVDGKFYSNHYERDYYINFEESNFENTHFISSTFSFLNLSLSNFKKSQFDESLLEFNRFVKTNFSGSRLNKVQSGLNIFSKANLTNTTILDSSFHFCNFSGAKFNESMIMNTIFIGSNLIGADFTDTNFIYDSEIHNGLDCSIYNTHPISVEDSFLKFDKGIKNYCQHYKNKYNYEKCFKALSAYSENEKITIFPEGFDPRKYNMINVNDFIEFTRQQNQ